MRRAALLGALCAALLPLGAARALEPLASPAAAPHNPPYILMRSLQTLQEQIAHGNAAAQAAQPKLMAHIADQFEAVDPDAWHDLRNAHAAVLFLLSGGKPAVIRGILEKSAMPADVDVLIKGALAYGEGQDDVARKLLDGVDPSTLPSTLGGHVALVKASLLTSRDGAKAEKLLDLARLLVPGTLVEEAALRRQIFLMADTGPLDKVLLLSRQYARRYRTSIFADNFRRRFMGIAKGLAVAGDVAQLSRVDGVLAEVLAAERCRDYLDLARSALLAGRTEAARYATDRAAMLATGERETARATLYLAAALVVTDDHDRGVTLLDAINASKLGPEDAGLLGAAQDVARLVRADPRDTGALVKDADAGSDRSLPALMEQAKAGLRDTDGLVQEQRP